jgi:hypothetical protein
MKLVFLNAIPGRTEPAARQADDSVWRTLFQIGGGENRAPTADRS